MIDEHDDKDEESVDEAVASIEQGEATTDAPDELREALVQMREEADRIATLGTSDEQVEAAEQFADAAGKLDEQVGAAARAADEDDNA